MELTKRAETRIVHAERQYLRLNRVFSSFVERASFLEGSQSPLTTFKPLASPDGDSLDVVGVGIHLKFVFLLCYGQDGTPKGRVVCLRETPRFSEAKDIIGSFTFSGSGTTDFEIKDGEDTVEMDYHTIEIILHFVDQAIAKQPL